MEEIIIMEGVTEYLNDEAVELVLHKGEIVNGVPYDRWVVFAKGDGWSGETQVDVLELVDWLKKNRPDLLV